MDTLCKNHNLRIVTTHKNMDFDALASVIAATLIYPEAKPVLPRSINPNVKAFLSLHKDLFETLSPSEVDFDAVGSLIVVDTNSWNRLDNFNALKEKEGLEIVLWDHHEGGDIVPTRKRQAVVGATMTLFAEELKQQRKLLTPVLATLFLMGIYEDTGNLTFSSTTSRDAGAAAYLLDRQADLSVLNSFLQQAYGEKQKNILFEMVQSAQRRSVNGYRLSFSTVYINGYVGNLSVVVNMFRKLENVDAAFGLFVEDEKGKCVVISRSRADGLDLGRIMRGLGGGGHPGAGSAQIKSEYLNPDSIINMICEMIDGNQHSSVKLGDIMSFPVVTVNPSTSMEELRNLLREKGCTGVPVVDEGRLVGVISRRDFKKIRKEAQIKSPVKAYMSPNVMHIPASKSPADAARLMIKHDIGRVPVVEDGNMIGIVTRTDAMRYFYDLVPD